MDTSSIGIVILILMTIMVSYMILGQNENVSMNILETGMSGAGGGGLTMSSWGQSGTGLETGLDIRNEVKKQIPEPTLYIYIGHEPSARKWTTFYGRRHRDPRSPILLTSQLSQAKNFQGQIEFINANHLLGLMTSDERITLNIKPEELCYHPILRDALLLRLVCSRETPAIVLPDHCFVQGDLSVLYELIMYQPGGRILDVLFDGHGNGDYGCPVIMTTIGNHKSKSNGMRTTSSEELMILREKQRKLKEVSNVLMVVAKEKEFAGGFRFWGGSSTVLDRIREFGLDGDRLGSDVISYPSSYDLLESDKPIISPLVVYPFPSGAGQVNIPSKDKWIYSVSIPTFFENDTPLRQIMLQSLGTKICYDILNL
jgi:hypothetical protein